MQESAAEFLISQLSVPQRLDLISRLWDSIPEEVQPQETPAWHREELERRIASADANPTLSVPWDQILRELRKQA